MQEVVSPTSRPLLIPYACGFVAGTLVLGLALYGLIAEASVLWKEGAATFFSDAAVRLTFGALVALLSAAPYLILGVGARRTGPPMFFASTSVLLILLQMGLSIEALFFAQNSTGAIGVIFLPIYALVAAAVIWIAAVLVRRWRSQ